MRGQNEERIRTPEAAQLLGVSPSTLAKWRKSGTGPPAHRIGERMVYYLRSEVEAYLQVCDASKVGSDGQAQAYAQ
jgi:predicted DNA-binding transcriptional regulator AlpA